MKVALKSIGQILGTELFKIGKASVSVSTLLAVLAILLATVWISRAVRRVVARVLGQRGGRPAEIGTLNGLIHYAILITGFGIALDTAGINLTALFAAGAIFAVGLGFAMQSIAQNFVAGVILLAERSIKPGDVLEVEGQVVKLLEMGIRASVAQTRDGEDLLIPNSILIQTTVKNYTLRDSSFRIRIPVGVVYRSDMALVKETLLAVAARVSEKWGVPKTKAQVCLGSFGDNSVIWDVAIWIDDPWEARPAKSELHEAIWWALAEKNIVIAFPQLDVHFDDPVTASLSRLSKSAA